ncbi:MAG TPA: SDR family NAD(P)-dependent oxidoreductase [Caulobacteraceae bacterium]|jgi:NAD(P)-dependent dehydrogenase (short-subunit alcohol dehydrogenase family)
MAPDAKPLTGHIALVTGATRGIGRATAQALAAMGAQVIAVGRTQGALEELDDVIRAGNGLPATLVPMDLAKTDGIDQLGFEIFERHRRLDILVHAAGILGGLRPVAHTPPEVWERLMAVNLTAAYRLIRSLDPLLRASQSGRAVFVTSDQVRQPVPFWGAYAATKAGLEALAKAWADEADGTPLRILLADPGPTRTALRHQAFPGEDKTALADPQDIGTWIAGLVASPVDPGPPIAIQRPPERRRLA